MGPSQLGLILRSAVYSRQIDTPRPTCEKMSTVSPKTIRSLLTETGFLSSDAEVTESESLFDAGVLDSLRLIEVVTALESQFDFRVQEDELIPNNFDSIVNLCTYVEGKLEARPI